jgi:TRAP-type C4-dicarboxylate transport system substrate-binding protein
MRIITTSLLAATLAVSLVSCAEPATRTGSTTEPIVLRPATGGGPGVGNDVMDLLAAATATSNVRVSQPEDADQVTPGADRTLELLADGEADIGVVRTGQLVTAGAQSLRALQAPLIVTNDEQAAAIAADPIAEAAMADLPKIGLVGLALVPGGLRHPFGYGTTPLSSASAFDGATINTRQDDAGVHAIMAALGAEEDHTIAATRTEKAASGEIDGIETALQQFGAVDLPAVITPNVTLYERFDVIIVRESLWSTLSPEQRDELMAAAAQVRTSAPLSRGTEASLLGEWCRIEGASAAPADEAGMASFHQALDPVVTSLESDPAAKEIIDMMRARGAGTTPDVVNPDCTAAPDEPAGEFWTTFEPVGNQTVLDGTWRFTPTEEDLLAAGLTASDARNNAGVWEVTLVDGTGTATLGSGHTCTWTFAFAGDTVLFDLGPEGPCGGGQSVYTAGTYTLDGDEVTFAWTQPGDDYGLKLMNGIFGKAVKVGG